MRMENLTYLHIAPNYGYSSDDHLRILRNQVNEVILPLRPLLYVPVVRPLLYVKGIK
jgi:hypothetical protein